ncbi:MAG TPA: ABC transporter permease subunit, partial [Candidatus Limnocylindrales bacterium]|nr:ABC transporter permease subunit [Candidatus Limnocylindrales bacterium]
MERVIGGAVPAASRPSIPARIYGLGSVFGKTLRDSTPAMLGVGLLLGLVVLVTMVAIGDQFDTLDERLALARQMELLPDFFQGLLGPAIALDTLPGFLSWRLVGIMPLMIGLWSVTALGATLASEAARGTLEMVLATPLRRRSLATQKFLGHAVALALALTFISVVAWLASIAFAKLPGDEMSLVTALSEFAMVGVIALFAGALAFMASVLFGRTLGIGIGGAYLFAAFAVKGYAGLVPGFDILRLGSVFYWTQGHRPMAGSSDWPAVAFVLALAAVFALIGVALFVRRDLNSTISLTARLRQGRAGRGVGVGLGLGWLSAGRWSLSGPGARSVADRLPEAIGWGVAMGMYGLFVAFAADSFAQVINSVPQIAAMVSMFYPNFDFESVGGILQFAIFAFISLLVGLAASSLVHGWSSDEREGRLETVLSTPVRRAAWFLRSAGGLFVAVLVMGLLIGAGPAIGAAAQGDAWPPLFVGGLVLGLYGAALIGVGLAVGGAGWPNLAALAVGGFTIAFYLLDLLGGLLGLPDELLNLSLTRHLGQPMVGDYDWP